MNKLLAQSINVNGQQIQGPLVGINTLGDVVNKILLFLFPIAGLILFIVLVWGGYDFLLSQGNPEKIKSARSKITAGIIGFLILVSAYIITRVIAAIFGIQNSIL